ncbi:MAG: hypothetical protein RLZ55_749, partial [Actinomycetota bacterium]
MTDHQADENEKDQVAGEVAAVIVPDQGELDVSGEAVTEVLFAPEQEAEAPPAAESATDVPATDATTVPDATAEPEADDSQDSPRRRRGRRRAASRPAGPPVFSAADEGDGPPPAAPRVQVPSTSMIAAVFQAPDAVVAAAQAKDDSAPQGTSAHPAGDDTEGAHRAEETDGQAASDGESEADEPGDGQGKPRRRRRRGGRGGRNRKADAGDS